MSKTEIKTVKKSKHIDRPKNKAAKTDKQSTDIDKGIKIKNPEQIKKNKENDKMKGLIVPT